MYILSAFNNNLHIGSVVSVSLGEFQVVCDCESAAVSSLLSVLSKLVSVVCLSMNLPQVLLIRVG